MKNGNTSLQSGCKPASTTPCSQKEICFQLELVISQVVFTATMLRDRISELRQTDPTAIPVRHGLTIKSV
jgi:hypothetical protein